MFVFQIEPGSLRSLRTGSGQAPAVGRDDGWGVGRRVRELRVSGNVMIRCEGLSVRSAALPSGIDRLFYIIRFFFAPAVPSEAAWPDRTAENRGRRRPPKTQFRSYNVPVRTSSSFVAASPFGLRLGDASAKGEGPGAAVTVETVIKCHDSSWRRSCHLQQILGIS